MLRRRWDVRNIPCRASSVSDHDNLCHDRSDIQVRLTRRESIQNCSDNNETEGTDVLNNAHVAMTHNQCDSCFLRALVPSREKTSHAKTQGRKETKGSHAPAKKQFRGMQP